MNEQHDQPELDDAGIEELLQQVGSRHEPAADVMNEVRQAVHAEWQATVRARKRQRFIGYAMAAGVACAALAAAYTLRTVAPSSISVASVARIDGHLSVGDNESEAVGGRITVGSTVRTAADSRAAFDFGNGVSVRADANSSFTVASVDTLLLERGALYVDAAGNANGAAGRSELKIDTSAGSVRHLGTQYQVREQHDDVIVAVREGRVEISGAHGKNVGDAGEQLHLSQNGNVQRSRISPQDASWQWAVSTAPTFKIADQSLATFLSWAARETGRKLVYESPAAESLARSVKLSGSIDGLNAEAALAAVLPTTSLRWHKTEDESIHIGVAAPIESHTIARPTP